MSRTGTLGGGIGVASLSAGPIFLTASIMADLYLRLPSPIVIDAQSAILVAALMFRRQSWG